jgi:hypothetical protein
MNINDKNWFEEFTKLIFQIQKPIVTVTPETVKDSRDIKTNLEVICQQQGMFVYVLAISNKSDANYSIQLSCKKGKPITKHCYDVTSDSYLVYGVDYLKIGYVPFNYQLRLKDFKSFLIDIPVPERLLKRYISESQLADLEGFKLKYKNCSYEFIQILKAY